MVLSYIQVNIPNIPPDLLKACKYFLLVSKYLLLFNIVVFGHYVFSVPHTAIKNVFFGGTIMLLYAATHSFKAAGYDPTLEPPMAYIIIDSIYVLILVYVFIVGMYYYKKVQNDVIKGFAKKLVILLGVFLPGIFSDTFLYRILPIRFFPILYSVLSIVFTYHLMKHYFPQSQATVSTLPDEVFFKRYNISSREQELVPLILQGYSNQKIGEILFISPNTVKTHIKNIYAKFGVKNRYEMISFIKDTCLKISSS